MSIPKEPRQLMINLMYLVLTAMLALNVSAKVMNAFFMIDKGIHTTNDIIDNSTAATIEGMAEAVKDKPTYKELHTAAAGISAITKPLLDTIAAVRQEVVNQSKGMYVTLEAVPSAKEGEKITEGEYKGYIAHITDKGELLGKTVGKKDKDTPQRVLVNNKRGENLFNTIESTREALKKMLVDLQANAKEDDVKLSFKEGQIEALIASLPLKVDKEGYEAHKKDEKKGDEYTLADYVFGHMPVAAVYPLFRKFENDVKTSESLIVSDLAARIGKLTLTYDKFDVFSQAPKGYILQGEKYSAEIALGAYSSQADFSVSVNGKGLKVVDGKALFETTGNRIGEQKYTASISVTNPMSGKKETFKKDFFYEVGQASVAVSLDKMNVFYVGVDNPVTIAAAGITTSNLDVKLAGNGTMTKKGKTSYIVKPAKQGNATINIKDKASGKSYPFKYRVKNIPEPQVQLGGKTDGIMKSGTFRVQPGLMAVLKNFDFDAKCKVQSYVMYYTPKRQDPIPAKGEGVRFSGNVAKLIKRAKIGDQYTFTSVKARCPGWKAAKTVNGLAFQIK